MAIFKIISSRRGEKRESAVFGIQPISGEVLVGDEFRCYETHHPVDYRVQAVESGSVGVTLFCAGFFFYDECFVGAIIDTTQFGKPLGFRYDVEYQVAGANRRWRGPFRCRGSRRESAVAQLFLLGVARAILSATTTRLAIAGGNLICLYFDLPIFSLRHR